MVLCVCIYMTTQTIRALNRMTSDFYARIGQFWNQDETYFWDGWHTLASLIDVPKVRPFSVLDIGCGNGRFASFCTQHLTAQESLYYHGIDNSAEMLSFTPQAQRQDHRYIFTLADVVESGTWSRPLTQHFSLVALMGLMHHIPSFRLRRDILVQAAECVQPGGYLCFTTWRFDLIPRLQKRVIDLYGGEARQLYAEYGINPGQFEEGDALLNWVKYDRAYRFSHQYSQDEITALIAATGLRCVAQFLHDGKESCRNEYFVLKK